MGWYPIAIHYQKGDDNGSALVLLDPADYPTGIAFHNGEIPAGTAPSGIRFEAAPELPIGYLVRLNSHYDVMTPQDHTDDQSRLWCPVFNLVVPKGYLVEIRLHASDAIEDSARTIPHSEMIATCLISAGKGAPPQGVTLPFTLREKSDSKGLLDNLDRYPEISEETKAAHDSWLEGQPGDQGKVQVLKNGRETPWQRSPNIVPISIAKRGLREARRSFAGSLDFLSVDIHRLIAECAGHEAAGEVRKAVANLAMGAEWIEQHAYDLGYHGALYEFGDREHEAYGSKRNSIRGNTKKGEQAEKNRLNAVSHALRILGLKCAPISQSEMAERVSADLTLPVGTATIRGYLREAGYPDIEQMKTSLGL